MKFIHHKDMKEIPGASSNNTNYLYTTEYNLVDFNVDDNGLWIIYSTAESNHTIVAKLDANTLEFQYSWNISVSHHKVSKFGVDINSQGLKRNNMIQENSYFLI